MNNKPNNSGDFLQSSAMIFIVNITIAVFNYTILVFASRILTNDYSVWTALNGLIAIFLTPINGISANINRQVADYTKTSPGSIQDYYNSYQNTFQKFLLPTFLFSPIVALILQFFISGTSFPLVLVTVIYLLITIYCNIRQNVLMGALQIQSYSIVMLCGSALRLVPSLGLLFLGLGLWALPVGLLISNICIFVISGYFLDKYFGGEKLKVNSEKDSTNDCHSERLSEESHLEELGNTKRIKEIPLKRVGSEADGVVSMTSDMNGDTEAASTDNFQNLDIQKTQTINWKNELLGLGLTTVSLFFLNTILNLIPIISQNSSFSADSKNLISVLFSFGQIIHFGSIAPLSSLISHISGSQNPKKILWNAIAISTTISIGVGVLFAFFGQNLLALLGRTQYNWAIPLIVLFAFFIALYNFIYISTQYFIAKHFYRPILFIIPGLITLLGFSFWQKFGVFNVGLDWTLGYFSQTQIILEVWPFLICCLVSGVVVVMPMAVSVVKSKK
jgi:Polysaccharide biosynthesis protein